MRLSVEGVGVVIDARQIVAGVDLVVEPGAMLALVGPNGSGKSMLLRTVYRALRPDSGVIRLGGEDAWWLRVRDSARRRAVVTQHGGRDNAAAVEHRHPIGVRGGSVG